jgi:hypothetical protein
MVGTNLFNAVQNELLPIIFEINSKFRYNVIASLDISKYRVKISVWEDTEGYENGRNSIYVHLIEINGEIVLDKDYESCMCPQEMKTYTDLLLVVKNYKFNNNL